MNKRGYSLIDYKPNSLHMKADYYRDQLKKSGDPNENYELYYEMNVFCINLKKEQESFRYRLDEFRERVMKGLTDQDFNHPEFNKVLDDFNDICTEIRTLEELMLQFDHEKAAKKRSANLRERSLAVKKAVRDVNE
jgi:hypothetical protein